MKQAMSPFTTVWALNYMHYDDYILFGIFNSKKLAEQAQLRLKKSYRDFSDVIEMPLYTVLESWEQDPDTKYYLARKRIK